MSTYGKIKKRRKDMEKETILRKMNKTSDLVKDILEKHPTARDDDFILYAWVLYYNRINLTQQLGQFLKTATQNKVTPFATVTKCRRTLQRENPNLKGNKVDERTNMQHYYKLYNQGNDYE